MVTGRLGSVFPLWTSLGRRLAVSLTLAVTVCFAAYLVVNLRQRRAELLEATERQLRDQGATLSLALDAMLQGRSLYELGPVAEALSRSEPIQGVVVFDPQGRPVVASPRAARQVARLVPLATRALRTGHPQMSTVRLGGHETLAYVFTLGHDRRAPTGAGLILRDLVHVQHSLQAALRRTVGIASVVVVVIVAVVLALAHRLVTKPVRSLLVGVGRIARENIEIPVEVRGGDEISQVGRAINEMRAALVEARAELQRDIERRVELEAKITAERRLQHAQRLSIVGRIAAGLAHEIGSPLHVIAGRARYGATRSDPKELRENLEVIATQADRITGVVEQLLAIGRRRRPHVVHGDLREVVRSVTNLVGPPEARQQRVDLQLAAGPEAMPFSGDPDALQQVFFNLVLNALQAQPDGGRIVVTLHRTVEADTLGTPKPRIIAEVRDLGPGIAPAFRAKLFDAFATSREEGTGLGLAIAQGIVQDHGGTINAVDPPDGGAGALFRVTLPVVDAESEPSA